MSEEPEDIEGEDGLVEIVNTSEVVSDNGKSDSTLRKLIDYPVRGFKKTARFIDDNTSVHFGFYQGAGMIAGLTTKYILPSNGIFSDGDFMDAVSLMLTTAGAITAVEMGVYVVGERITRSKPYLTSAIELFSIRKVEIALTVLPSTLFSALQMNFFDSYIGVLGAAMSTTLGPHTVHNFAVGLGVNRFYKRNDDEGIYDKHIKLGDSKDILSTGYSPLVKTVKTGLGAIGKSVRYLADHANLSR